MKGDNMKEKRKKPKRRDKMCYGTLTILDKFSNGLMYADGSWFWGERPTNMKRIRIECPECGRRFMSSVSVCHDGCCLYHSVPTPHKRKGWWRKWMKIASYKVRCKYCGIEFIHRAVVCSGGPYLVYVCPKCHKRNVIDVFSDREFFIHISTESDEF